MCCFPPVQTGCMHISKNTPSSPGGIWLLNQSQSWTRWSSLVPSNSGGFYDLFLFQSWAGVSALLNHNIHDSSQRSSATGQEATATLWSKGNEFLLWMWSGTGASFPERMWSLHLWRYLKVDKTLSSPIWLALHWAEGWTRDLPGVTSLGHLKWFCFPMWRFSLLESLLLHELKKKKKKIFDSRSNLPISIPSEATLCL